MSTATMTADDNTTSRPKTPPSVLQTVASDGEQLARTSSQTEGIVRRFIVEMDGRRRQRATGTLTPPGGVSENYRRATSTSTSTSVSASSNLDAADAAAVSDDEQEELMS